MNFINNLNQIIIINLQKFLNYLNLPAGIITTLFLILAGLLLVFFGYKLRKISIVLIGFIFGIFIGYYLCSHYFKNIIIYEIVIMFISGLVFAFLFFSFYYLSVILIGFFAGFFLGLTLANLLGLSSLLSLLLTLFIAIITGFLSLKIEKVIFILSTAYIGYILLKIGFHSVSFVNFNIYFKEISALIIMVFGIIYQFYQKIDNDQ